MRDRAIYLLLPLLLPFLASAEPSSPPLAASDRALSSALPQEPWRFDPDDDGPPLSGAEALPNFAAVSTTVYRSGQPGTGGLARAKALGARSVLDLRLKADRDERDEAARLGLGFFRVPMNGVYSPTFGQVDRALAVLQTDQNAPVLVHCHYGKDRTGVVIAAYRVVVQGWSVDRAAAEARQFGCCAPFFLQLEDWLDYYLKHRSGDGRGG